MSDDAKKLWRITWEGPVRPHKLCKGETPVAVELYAEDSDQALRKWKKIMPPYFNPSVVEYKWVGGGIDE